jgi:hypothetical protein
MKVGKLYQVTKYFWMVFPSKELICKALHLHIASLICFHEAEARATSQHCNDRLNWKVSYIPPTDVFVSLQQDEQCRKILTANGEIGWIWVCESDSFLVEEIKQ